MTTLLFKIISSIRRIIRVSQSLINNILSREKRNESFSSNKYSTGIPTIIPTKKLSPAKTTFYSIDSKEIVSPDKTSSILVNELRELRLATHRGQKRRYKPILLLVVCHLIDLGEISENKIYLTLHLENLYKQIAVSVGYEETANIGLPFFHLHTSTFWCHKVFSGQEQVYKNHPSLGQSKTALSQTVEYAFFNPNFSDIFFGKDSRSKIQDLLLNTYFTDIEKENIYKILRGPLQSESSPIYQKENIENERKVDKQLSLLDEENVSSEPTLLNPQTIIASESMPENEQNEIPEIDAEKPCTESESSEKQESNISESDTEKTNLDDTNLEKVRKTRPIIDIKELDRRAKETAKLSYVFSENSLKEKTLLPVQKPKKKNRHFFYFDVHQIPEIEPEILDKFLHRSEEGSLKEMNGIDPLRIEELLLSVLKTHNFIGELPFCKSTFDFFCELIQREYISRGRQRINDVHPALFITSMVFCARYSEEDAKKFWQPYADLVWQTVPSQYFQNVCRKHYLESRDFLLEHFDLEFPALTEGGVVRPIYYQAVIPYYLQSTFADWLISNFEQVLQFSTHDLPSVLQIDKSLNYMPKAFKSFVTGTETREASAKLITQLAKAIKLFQTTEQFEAVYSIIDSPIERSLWERVYQNLVKAGIELKNVRSYTAKVDWVWNMETMDLGLQLSQVRSNKSEKPNLIIWARKDNRELISEENISDVHPWRLENGDWELESEIIYELGDPDGNLFVLSEEFDLEAPISEQKQHIVYSSPIPGFPENYLFFFIPSKRNIARLKERININGEWIILCKEDFDIQGHEHQGVNIIDENIQIPHVLQKAGFRYVKQFQMILPVDLQSGSENINFDQPGSANIFEAKIVGENPINQISQRVQPIFKSKEIEIQTYANFPIKNFQRIWVSIYRANRFQQSISLDTLKQRNLISSNDNEFVIALSEFIDEPGLYTINILHNLHNLLETPLKFAYLPEINLKGPEPNKCYSPEHPAVIEILGIPGNRIVIPENQKVKREEKYLGTRLVMREMREPDIRFSLQWAGNNIQICYEIERVTAWVEGAGDKLIVIENQTNQLVIHARGKPNERYNLQVNNSHFDRDFYLNAKGKSDEYIEKTALRDILRISKFINTEIWIKIRGQSWRLFTYVKFPKIDIKEVQYKKNKISITLEQENPLYGNYKLQVKNETNLQQQFDLGLENNLQKKHDYEIALEPGEYTLEILCQNEVVAKSAIFKVFRKENQVSISGTENIRIPISYKYTAAEIYASLSASPQAYFSFADHKSEDLLPIIEQLKLVNDFNTWINPNGKLDENFKILLPTWAVINHPLRVVTEKHRKIMHLFPQKVAYGGKFGKGFIKAKFIDGPINLYAAWKTNLKSNQTFLWVMVPQRENITRFCDLDEYDLWPGYLCVDCGVIVGSKDGTRLKLPPKTISLHAHKKHSPLNQQFIDIVYEKNIQANISYFYDEILDQIDNPSSIVDLNFSHDRFDGRTDKNPSEIEKPINPNSSNAYRNAYSELHRNYSEIIHSMNLKQIIGKQNLFTSLEYEFGILSSDFIAFRAFFRLYKCFKITRPLSLLPKYILILAMLLRYKAHFPQEYKFAIHHTKTEENEIAETTYFAMLSCPKLLEWSIYWAEVFFHHAPFREF